MDPVVSPPGKPGCVRALDEVREPPCVDLYRGLESASLIG